MLIQVTSDIRFKVEEGCTTMETRRVVTGENCRGRKPKQESIGQERWSPVGYFSGPTQAATSLLTRHIDLLSDSGVECDLKEMVKVIKSAEAVLRAVLISVAVEEHVEAQVEEVADPSDSSGGG